MIIHRDMIYTPKDKSRPLHIYLPDSYDESDERYPVMYFFDGHNMFRDEWATYGKAWCIDRFLDGWDRDIIIVGIECGHEGDERLDEYCPYNLPDSRLGDIHGMGEETMDWIVGEIKPLVDNELRTLPDRDNTGIGGSSMGGLMSYYAGIKYNEFFSKAACLSSSIGVCWSQMKDDLAQSYIDPQTKFYISWGTREAGRIRRVPSENMNTPAAKANIGLAALIEERGADTRIYCQIGGRHCEADWEKQIPIFMDYLWK